MKHVVATAICLVLSLFLLPLLIIQGEPLASLTSQPPMATGTLPIDRTVLTPTPAPTTGGLDSAKSIRVTLADGTIETTTMDKYLWSVAAAEMPASFELEALKAQVVAARTYTVAKMGREIANHPDADVCADINCCQAYIAKADALANWGGNGETYGAKISAAVSETDGMVALYQGVPIQAVFFSSAAGKTVDAVEVWGNSVPYLSGVESPEGDEVPNYHSAITVPLEEFKAKILAAHPDANFSGAPSTWFQNLTSNSAGGVSQVSVGGVVMKGSELRSLFKLRSTTFTSAVTAEGVIFSVTGYGHGVGMSQYGANALAKEGKNYQEIIKWYYTGVNVEAMS